MNININGIGIVSPLGSDINQIKNVLSGLEKPIIKEKIIKTKNGEIQQNVFSADTSGIEKYIPKASLRRLDNFSKMAILASSKAIEDSEIYFENKTKIGIIIGSAYGPFQTTFQFLDSIIDFGDKCASPTLFATSVHNSIASQISIINKIEGPCHTITCFENSAVSAFLTARNWLLNGIADFVLLGIGDEYHPVRGYFEANLIDEKSDNDALSKSYLSPGESFICFILSKKDNLPKKYAVVSDIVYNISTSDAGEFALSSIIISDIRNNKDLKNPESVKDFNKFSENYGKLFSANIPILKYNSLYGYIPGGNAIDAAIAAISLNERKIFHPGQIINDAENIFKKSSVTIGCVNIDKNNNGNMIILKDK